MIRLSLISASAKAHDKEILAKRQADASRRRREIREDSDFRASCVWLGAWRASKDPWQKDFPENPAPDFRCKQFPRYRGLFLGTTRKSGESDFRAPDMPPGTSYERVNAHPGPKNPRDTAEISHYLGDPRPLVPEISRWEAKKSRKQKAEKVVSARSKDLQRGRVDPAATFHGITHEVACEIDCHKNKPVRKSQESPELKALLDDWESRTGKTAPSRR